MNFYTILQKLNNMVIADVVEFDDGVCVVKYENSNFPNVYQCYDDMVKDLSLEYYLVKDGIKEV